MEVAAKVNAMDSPPSEATSDNGEKLKIVPKENVRRNIMDPVEDSGFSSISTESASEIGGNSNKVESAKGTIGEDIKFVDPQLIVDEQRLRAKKLERRKRKGKEKLEKKKAEREAFEKEIQEQQYKRLMHLLHQSKALTSFIVKKVDDKNNEKKAPATRKRSSKLEEEPVAKKGKKTPKKAASKRGTKKLNLSDEEIKEELNLSDEEMYTSPNKENENANSADNFVQPKYFEGELRNYQKEGVNWLRTLYENGLNGILADEMGLGKTIQVIALFSLLFEKNIPGPYMVIVPLSTLPNWTSEFERFAPQLPVVVYYGNEKQRMGIRSKIERKKTFSGSFKTNPIVLTTYQVPINDAPFLRQFNWRYIVIDEAQRIKNYETQLFRIVKSLTSVNRLLLTGTPLQNNLTELWSLLNFLLPDIFNNLEVFQDWFDPKRIQNDEGREKFFQQEQEKQVMATLREILHPFMLRRLKEEVCPDLPPIKEVVIYTPLTRIQYDLYSSIIKRDMSKLQKVKEQPLIIDVNGVRPKRRCTQQVNLEDAYFVNQQVHNDNMKSLNSDVTTIGTANIKKDDLSMWNKFTNVTEENVNYLIRLRMCNEVIMYRHVVNHPYLIHYPMNDCGLGLIDENLITGSGKILVLDKMLKKLKSNGHKVLMFSTMTMVLNIIEDYLSMTDYQYVRLDGGVDHDTRKESIDRFQTDPEVFLFLLTTKAGAVGLNLAAADTVIIYDSDWNPQNDLQAMARCHRIGQTRPVAVYRLCTKGTIDEDIIKRANAKRFLEKAVISKEGKIVNTADGLMRLKKMLDEETFKIVDLKNQVYTDAELDELLDRSDMVFSSKKAEST